MPPPSAPIANNVPGLVLLILIIAVPLAFLASVGILSLYRGAVLRTMRTRINSGRSEAGLPETAESTQTPTPIPLNVVTLDSAALTTNQLTTDLLRKPWHAATIYSIAGLCYALVTTIIFLIATRSGFHLLGFLIIFWYYAWPVAVTICLVAAGAWQKRLFVLAIYFLVIVLLWGIALIGNSSVNWAEIILLWFLTNFPAALVLLAFLNRRIQAVGPLVLTFMILAVTGAVLLPRIVNSNEGLLRLVISVGVALGLGGVGIFNGLVLLGFLLFGAVGWWVLQRIGTWYQQKRISVQSITMDAVWLLFGIFQSIGLIFEGEKWFVISLLAFVVYKLVSWVGFAWYGNQALSTRPSPNLLLLRVFSLGKRSERLFDMLTMYWRYAGSIQLISGPDLATVTMEPQEFLDFLSGKLARRFIDNAQTLDLRLSQLDVQPDLDGLFRVNDFFCYEDTWRMVLSRLVNESDVVLMDLRGFSSQNSGVIFEIGELINMVPLEKVLFIIDGTTDESFLHQTLQQAWENMKSMSPNRQSKSGLLHLFRLDRLRDRELQQLLRVLVSATGTAPA